MSTELTLPQGFGPISPLLKGLAGADELGAGITSSFGVVSYKGKVWSIKYQGKATPLLRPDDGSPQASIEVVIVKASTAIAKIFYKDGFQDGNDKAPDCFSTNGLTPDPASPAKQCATCAACPNNAWGSKITEAGKQTKACTDSKRLAIVPLTDMGNDLFGGPMLLRVPAASLKDLKTFGDTLAKWGYPSFAVGVRISFDYKEAFPKFMFGAIRPLTDDEAKKVIELRESDAVERILSLPVEQVVHEPEVAGDAAQLFEQPPKPVATNGQAASVASANVAAATAAATPDAQDKLAQLKALQEQMAQKAKLEELQKAQLAEKARLDAIQAEKDKLEAARREAARLAEEAAAKAAAEAAKVTPAGNGMSEIERQIAELQAQLAGGSTPAATVTPAISSGEERVNPEDVIEGEVLDGSGSPVNFDDLLESLLPNKK